MLQNDPRYKRLLRRLRLLGYRRYGKSAHGSVYYRLEVLESWGLIEKRVRIADHELPNTYDGRGCDLSHDFILEPKGER